jgi:hypothetical protein
VLSLLFFLAVAPAAPVPTHLMPPPPFYPAKVGAKWVYTVTGDIQEEIVETIEKVEENDGTKIVGICVTHEEVIRGVRMRETTTRKVELREDGLFCVAPWPEVAGSISCLFQLPYHAGDKWEETHPKLSLKRMCEAFPEERVEVPAGKFQAVQIETRYARNGGKESCFSNDWYVRGIGLVKHERKDIDRLQVLKSFTPGTR